MDNSEHYYKFDHIRQLWKKEYRLKFQYTNHESSFKLLDTIFSGDYDKAEEIMSDVDAKFRTCVNSFTEYQEKKNARLKEHLKKLPENLESMTRAQLYQLTQDLGVCCNKSYKKDEMIRSLKNPTFTNH